MRKYIISRLQELEVKLAENKAEMANPKTTQVMQTVCHNTSLMLVYAITELEKVLLIKED